MDTILHRPGDHASMTNYVKTPCMIVDRYAIFDEIGSGGMATVHLARLHGQQGFSRIVVVKRLQPQLVKEPELRHVLADEARMTSRVRHPNVVPVLDVMSSDDELLMVLEYVPGVTLAELLRASRLAGRGVDPTIAAGLIAGLLRGLHAAHTATNEQGELLHLVHRDVSPDNVLVGTDGLAHLLDFGIAKARGRLQQTRGEVWKGKPSYMAPEQLRDGEVSPRSDVYACAVVLWETLTGYRLFQAENDYAVSVKVFEKPVDPPSRVARGVPEALDEIVLRGLSREAEDRYGTAAEMAEALEEAVEPAREGAVRQWVSELCGEQLEARARQVEAVEQASLVPATSGDARTDEDPLEAAPASTPVAQPVAPSRGPWWLLAAGVVGLGLLGWFAIPRAAEPPPRSDASEPAPLVLPAVSTPPVTASASAVPAAADSVMGAGVEPTGQPAGDAPEKVPVPRAKPTATKTAAPERDCDPPYVVDEQGYHRMKRECL